MELRRHARSFARFGAVVAAAALASAGAPAAGQENTAVPGTSVSLTPPAGFTVSRGGRELEDGAGSSITIGERSAAAYPQLAEMFSSARNLSAGYAQQKVSIRGVRQIATPLGAVPFATGRQTSNGRDLEKYFALLKGDKTVLMTFTVADRRLSEADIEAVVRSVSLKPEPTLDERLATLSFTFRAVEPFRVREVINRNTVTLTTSDENPEASRQPVIVIGRGTSQAAMGDEPRVAIELLTTTGGLQNALIGAQGPTPFAGGNGYVVTAVVDDRTVIQYLRIIPGGAYLRLLARGPTSAIQDAEATIAEIAATVESN
jgi:hypothetical protein